MADEIATMTDEVLAVAIAREVMGWREAVDEHGPHWVDADGEHWTPEFADYGDDMLTLIHAMRARGMWVQCAAVLAGYFAATVWHTDDQEHSTEAEAATLPRAVAEAALAAVRQRADSTAPSVAQAGAGEVEAVSRG